MRIGEASRLTGLPPKTIRYYERTGLIDPPSRGGATYRDFGADDIARLRFLCRARDLGFSMAHMRELLSLWRDVNWESGAVKRLVLEHLAALEASRAALEVVIATLRGLMTTCEGDPASDYSIIDDLASNDRAHDREPSSRDARRGRAQLACHETSKSRARRMMEAKPT